MSLENEQIKNEFGQFAAKYGPAAIMPAVVTAVNDDGTVSVGFSDGSTVDDARLKAVVKEGNQFLLIPKVDSNVLVGRIENSDEYVVVAVDEITEVKIKIDEGIFLIERDATKMRVDEKFLFKNNSEDLLTLIKDLIQANIDERHMTNTGPSISLTPDSVLKYNQLKTRFANLLSNT